jgi:hypothetical protein
MRRAFAFKPRLRPGRNGVDHPSPRLSLFSSTSSIKKYPMEGLHPMSSTYRIPPCRQHVFADDHRCGSPALRGETHCYHHHPDGKASPSPSPTTASRSRALSTKSSRASPPTSSTFTAPACSSTASRSPAAWEASPNPRHPLNSQHPRAETSLTETSLLRPIPSSGSTARHP